MLVESTASPRTPQSPPNVAATVELPPPNGVLYTNPPEPESVQYTAELPTAMLTGVPPGEKSANG